MNIYFKTILLSLLLNQVATNVYAYDIAVKNTDGVTIYYNYINDGVELEVTYKDYNNNEYSGDIVIPDEVTFMERSRKVTRIGRDAFYNCKITSIIIPKSVTAIYFGAFSESKLKSISIPNSVKTLAGGVFYKCHDLVYVNLPEGLTEIGEVTFGGCVSLKSLTIPNSVKKIKLETFHGCSNLEEVDFGNGIVEIEELAFYECRSINNVVFPNSLTTIGDKAFADCPRLTSVTLPDGLSTIGTQAFQGCPLDKIVIPKSVKRIGGLVFVDSEVSCVISEIEEPFRIVGKSSNQRTFSLNTFNNATLYVPVGTKEKYMVTEGWKDFLFIEEGNGINNSLKSANASINVTQTDKGYISVSGLNDGTIINIFGLDGAPIGSEIISGGKASINTKKTSGNVVLVQIGDKSYKVIIK